MTTQVTPFLMFTGRAEEALRFYVGLFDDAEILELTHAGPEHPAGEGSVLMARISLGGQVIRLNDSPPVHDFTFTPSMSLFVTCDDAAAQEKLVAALLDGGNALMPLDDYGFGPFAWVADRFGVSWQLSIDLPR